MSFGRNGWRTTGVMTTSKSPRKVMAQAYAAAQASLPAYSHVNSPRKFTQHQLFACLVLKEHQKKDYRGVRQLLLDCSDLRQVIQLQKVPHYTTLQKASRRLLQLPRFRRMLAQSVRQILQRRIVVRHAAADSTGFDAHHASRYYVHRRDNNRQNGENRPKNRVMYKRHGKLMLIVCCATHAILAAVASAGPAPDIDQLDAVVAEVVPQVKLRRMALDAGFDSGHNHTLLREDNGILSFIPPRIGRPSKDPAALPPDRHRRLMKRWFKDGNRPAAYRYRVQNETVNSMLKRNLGAALAGKTHHSRRRDMLLRVLAHNLMIALLWVFYRANVTPFSV